MNQSRLLANEFFRDAVRGLPGNSDAGALNSWLVWQMLGLYPIVTQPVYLLESPWFTDINITLSDNATLRIMSNGDTQSLGHRGFYVESIRINGEEWNKNVSEHFRSMTVFNPESSYLYIHTSPNAHFISLSPAIELWREHNY